MDFNTAIIICIGDELLIGQVVDTNSVWLAQQLEKLGIQVCKKIAIADTQSAIINTLQVETNNADLIILTGGLGPTKDDVTKLALCNYFGVSLVRNAVIHEHVKHFFKKRNRPMLPVNDAQADLPDNCIALFNRTGTAPGMLFEKDDAWIVSMPGVPTELKIICEEELFPRIKSTYIRDAHIVHKHLLTFGRGESFAAADIADIEAALPAHLHLAYLPHNLELRLRLSGTGRDGYQLTQEMDIFMSMIRERLAPYVVSDKDESMAAALVGKLDHLRMTLATAESCTGGLISSKITDVPGASRVYHGSVVSYDNAIKENVLEVSSEILHEVGAVSERAVLQMASKCRQMMQADFAVSVSGVLGPDGGTEEKPIGTVWFGIDGPMGVKANKYNFYGDRIINKETAANMAIFLVLKQLNALAATY